MMRPYLGTYWKATYQPGFTEAGAADTAVQVNDQSINAVAAVFGLNANIALSQSFLTYNLEQSRLYFL